MGALSGLKKPAQWLINWATGNTAGRKSVSADDALGTAPAWYATSKIAGHLGILPLNVHLRVDGGSEVQRDHRAHKLMRQRPNSYQLPVVFKEMGQVHALWWGNFRAYIARDSAGNPAELIPMMPDRTATCLLKGEKWHVTQPYEEDRIRLFENMNNKNTLAAPDDDVFHVPGLGFDGVCGKSLLRIASDTLTVAVDGSKRAANQMQNGFSASMLLEDVKGRLRNPEDARKFLKQFREQHNAKSGETVGLLLEGMKANVLTMSNRDAEFIANRKFSREEIALLLGIETMPGDGNDSYNSLEHRNLAYLSGCLQRWLVKWEEESDRKLLTQQERDRGYYFKFNTASLLRTDLQTTINSFGNAIASRIMNPNEARERLDMNPYEGGDTFENPAITPGQPGSTEAQNRHQALSRVEHMVGIEQKRVQSFLDKGKSFDHIQGWYESWEQTLGEVIVSELGGSDQIVMDHIAQSLAFLKKGSKRFDLSGTADLLVERIFDV